MASNIVSLISQYSNRLPAPVQKLVPTAGLLLLTFYVNQYLNRKALNNGATANFDWDKEIVLVTGGSDGIGAATVKRLAERGTTVVVLDIRPLTYTACENVHYYPCDLTNREELTSAAEKLTKDVGDPTCIVACAGICRGKTLLDATPRDIEVTFGVNNLALIWTIKQFLPSMIKNNHGHFLMIASQTAHLSTAGVVDYAATKAATVAIYEGLQTELRHNYGAPAVRVSCVSPSAVQTNMFRGIQMPHSAPLLKTDDVASLVAEILWSERAQNKMIPAAAYISPPTRALPDWMRVAFQDLGKDVMSNLSPHQPMK